MRILRHLNRPAQLVVRSASNVPEQIRAEWGATGVNVKELTRLMDHDNHEMRKEFREYLRNPEFQPKYAIPLNEERELALKRLQMTCDKSKPFYTSFIM